jgi:transposase
VLPVLYGYGGPYSYDQILSACEYMGSEYHKIIEILARATAKRFSLDTRVTYFDCTNFYFEIDRESDFQKNGPSKEDKKAPLVGMGLLLDASLIPVDMDLFPGNESEKPKIRGSIKRMRERNHIGTRTIMVADKGLNCARNIHQAALEGDGYLFSKSVKGLSDAERTWMLLENGWEDIVDGGGKVVYRLKECTDRFTYEYDGDGGTPGKRSFAVTEKRVVTFNPKLREKQILELNRLIAKAQGLCLSKAKKREYGECSKFVTFRSTSKGSATDDKVVAEMNRAAIDKARLFAGYNMLVTSETYMPSSEIYSTYHNLWRIEETFRIMKTDLDARPVFLQKEECIIGHFLVCYVTVLLERLLEFHVLGNRYGGSRLISWMRSFRVVKDGGLDYVNLMPASDMTTDLAGLLSLPLTNYYLRQGNLTRMFNLRLGKETIHAHR